MESTKSRTQSEKNARDLALKCARAAYDKKAESIRIFHVGDRVDYCDYLMVCSAHNERQVRAIADSLRDCIREDVDPTDWKPIEGYEEGRWILLDAGDIVVHIFVDALRDYYDMDGLWSQCPRLPLPEDFFGHEARQDASQDARQTAPNHEGLSSFNA
jgi:ribosome-associated protein